MKQTTKKFIIALTLIFGLCLLCTMKVDAKTINDTATQGLIGAVDNSLKENAIEETTKPIQLLSEKETLITALENNSWWGGFRAFVVSPKSIDSVPLYNQCDYPSTPYGKYGTIKSHGCGIVSLSMVATYLTDTIHSPVTLAKQFGNYNTENGSYWILFEDSAKELGLKLQERTNKTKDVVKALQNGQVVVALQSKGLFTSSGHFIVLTGMTEDGEILVNDPYGKNYTKNKTMIKGFAEGFTQEQIFENGGPYWIYEKKEAKKDKLFFDFNVLNYKISINSPFVG